MQLCGLYSTEESVEYIHLNKHNESVEYNHKKNSKKHAKIPIFKMTK